MQLEQPPHLLPKLITFTATVLIILIPEQHIADYSSVGCTIQLSKLQVPNTRHHKLNTFRSLKIFDQTVLCTDPSAILWINTLNESPNVNAMVSNFNIKFLSIWDKHCPVIT